MACGQTLGLQMGVEKCALEDDEHDVLTSVGEFVGLMGVLESQAHDADARRSCEARRRRAARRRRSLQVVFGLLAISVGGFMIGYERQLYLTLLLLFVRGTWRQYMEGRFGLVALEGVAFMLFAVACAGAGIAFTLEYGEVEKDMRYYHSVAELCRNEATRTTAEGSKAGKMLCANATDYIGYHTLTHVFGNLYARGLVSIFFNGSPSDLYRFVSSGTGVGGWAFGLAIVAIIVIALGSSIVNGCMALCVGRAARVAPAEETKTVEDALAPPVVPATALKS